jgi:4-amino-4-deoxy-L-arabinose transferase-like glycosyltransferase
VSERRRTWVIACAIVAVYFAIQAVGLRWVGLTDDDDFYIPAGNSYAAWVARAARLEAGAWTRPEIEKAFDPNHEHPPIAKYAFGAASAIFAFLGPVDGARMATVLFSTLIAALVLTLTVGHFGRRKGIWIGGASVFLLLTLPRFFFHSHAATLDVPVAAMVIASATVALFAERSRRAAWLAGPIFGLALATKLNAPFFLVAYLGFILLIRRGVAPSTSAFGVALPQVPLALVSMLTVGPIVFVLVWPWIWFDTFQRIGAYVGFHLHHYGIYFLYFGRVYDKDPFAPWHAPFMMAAATTPFVTNVFALIGIRLGLPAIVNRLRFTTGPDDDHRKEGDLLLMAILNCAVTIAAVAFSGGAKYGGEKLFMPFFPFWCLLGGYGAVELFLILRQGFGQIWGRYAVPALFGVSAASLLALQIAFGAYALSEYNGLVGGLRGATAIGFERQYYDVAFRDLVDWLNDNAPPNTRVHFLPNNWEYVRTYNWYRRSGVLRGDIQVANGEGEADWVVITHERRFARYGEDLRRYRTKPVLREKILDGTPIWSVVKAR